MSSNKDFLYRSTRKSAYKKLIDICLAFLGKRVFKSLLIRLTKGSLKLSANNSINHLRQRKELGIFRRHSKINLYHKASISRKIIISFLEFSQYINSQDTTTKYDGFFSKVLQHWRMLGYKDPIDIHRRMLSIECGVCMLEF